MNRLEEILHETAHLLPSQGPLDVFVHHNTLHAFEHMPFGSALEAAAKIYGARAYWPESRYLDAFARGRIEGRDLNEAIVMGAIASGSEPQEQWLDYVRAYLLTAVDVQGRTPTLWCLTERAELDEPIRRFGSRRWDGCAARETALLTRQTVAARKAAASKFIVRHRFWSETDDLIVTQLEKLLEEPVPSMHQVQLRLLWLACLERAWGLRKEGGGIEHPTRSCSLNGKGSIEELALPIVTKLAAAFVDRGVGGWSLPQREKGFLVAALRYLSTDSGLRPWIIDGIEPLVRSLEGKSGLQIIEELLHRRRIPETEWDNTLRDEILGLKGWCGFMHLLERRPDLAPCDRAQSKEALADFVAIKMLIYSFGAEKLRAMKEPPVPDENRLQMIVDRVYSIAYHLFRWCQFVGMSAAQLDEVSNQPGSIIRELFVEWSQADRERVWHRAFERNFERRFYDAFTRQAKHAKFKPHQPRFQVVCCIDDREESFRRYLEEIGEHIVTYGTAGFFGVDVNFQELGKRSAPYCPVVVTPNHEISEVMRPEFAQKLGKARSIETAIGNIMLGSAGLSRRFVWEWVAGLTGAITFLPMVLRTIFPRLPHLFDRAVLDPLREGATDILYARDEAAVSDAEEKSTEMFQGYSPQEMCDRVAGLLKSIGLTSEFAPIITIMGHGSSSKNNPFKSAYDCGACGGRPGRVNARVFALMANRPDVRQLLRDTKGVTVPESTIFVGAYHDTCNDSVIYFDTELIPASHHELFEELRGSVQAARARNADERCRRFAYAQRGSPENALAYVEGRAQHIAEPRPEYGHATNAMCIIGRRGLTRGLFLDRRSFLVSYDHRIDESGALLAGLLRAVVPVCTGINLEYFFSSVDNDRYGAGSKLPANIASLVGVITGYASDLRTGLPAQMVEIHEPVRLVMVIDSTRDRVQAVLTQLPAIANLVKNEWLLLSVFDEQTGTLARLKADGSFEQWQLDESGGSEVWGEEILTTQSSDNLPFVVIH